MGGDLNIFANPRDTDKMSARHASVLGRVEALGLQSCIAMNRPPRRRLRGCPCGLRACVHQQTYVGTKTDQPYEEDYLFASERLAARLDSCVVVTGIATSDHAPIKASFNL
jgi:hypothetical protein